MEKRARRVTEITHNFTSTYRARYVTQKRV